MNFVFNIVVKHDHKLVQINKLKLFGIMKTIINDRELNNL